MKLHKVICNHTSEEIFGKINDNTQKYALGNIVEFMDKNYVGMIIRAYRKKNGKIRYLILRLIPSPIYTSRWPENGRKLSMWVNEADIKICYNPKTSYELL